MQRLVTLRSVFLALLFAAFLLGAAMPVEAQGQRSPTADEARDQAEDRRGEDAADEDEDEDERDGRSDESREERGRSDEARARRAAPVPIGAFALDAAAGSATGDYVSFTYDARGLHGFTADGVQLFDLTLAEGTLAGMRDVRAEGSKLRVEADGFKAVVHDNPSAVSRIESDERVVIQFASGTQITPTESERRFAFSLGNVSGTIRGEDLALDGSNLSADGDILVLLDNARASADKHRPDIVAAIGKGRVGAEASFLKRGDELEHEVVSYGNVTMTTVKAEPGNLTVLIDGHGFEGRVLVFNVDGRVVGAAEENDLQILFDNGSIAEAEGLMDVLDPDDDGLAAEYYVVFDPRTETFQLILSVPHYSVHTLTVGLVQFLPPPSVVVGIVAGVALLVPSAWALFGRRRAT